MELRPPNAPKPTSLLGEVNPFILTPYQIDAKRRLARLGRRPDGKIKQWPTAVKPHQRRMKRSSTLDMARFEAQQTRDRERLRDGNIRRVNLTGWSLDAGMYMTPEAAQRAVVRLARWISANPDKPSSAAPRHIRHNAYKASEQFREA